MRTAEPRRTGTAATVRAELATIAPLAEVVTDDETASTDPLAKATAAFRAMSPVAAKAAVAVSVLTLLLTPIAEPDKALPAASAAAAR